MLDLSLRNKEGNDILYYLIRHNDISNFRQYVDRDELTEELARRHVTDGETPLAMCLRLGRMEFVRAVMLHPTAKDKFAFPRGCDTTVANILRISMIKSVIFHISNP